MTASENRSIRNCHKLGTWPSLKCRPMVDQSMNHKTKLKTNHDSELHPARHDSFQQIFKTDSSKTVLTNQQNTSQSYTTTARSNGRFITTSFRKVPSNTDDHSECPVCCNTVPTTDIKQIPCCSFRICSSCLLTHTITNINNGKAKIECPSCSQDINSTNILYDSEVPASIREHYQQVLASDLSKQQNTLIKLCPHCNFITVLDENDPHRSGKKSRSSSNGFLSCEQCNEEWCWSCYAPAHYKKTCRQFKRKHSQLDVWAKSRRDDNGNQRNARRCPKCSIYIEKIDGCDHITCTECNSKFCYRCGSRMRLPFYIGHDAKYSIFGCKEKLWPTRPLLRWLTRGSILAGVCILTPIALSALIALLSIGVPTVLFFGSFALPVFLYLEVKRPRRRI